MHNFIFDLDGTLINSSNEVLNCLEKAFDKANYPLDKTRLSTDIIGPPLKTIINNLAPELENEDKLNEIMKNFRHIYDYDDKDVSEIYSGVYECLDELKNSKCRIFMATFKPTIPTMRIVKQFKLNYFDDIYTIDKFDRHITKEEMLANIIEKYKLNPKETAMIGDAKTDMTAAKMAGITGIGALWGYGSDKSGLIENADFTINTIGELCQKLNYQTI